MHRISWGAQEDTQKSKSNKTCLTSLRSFLRPGQKLLKQHHKLALTCTDVNEFVWSYDAIAAILKDLCSLQYPKPAVTGTLNSKVYVIPGQTHRSHDKALRVADPTGMWDFLRHKNPVIESTTRRWNSLNPCCFENNGEERRTHSDHRGTSNNT